MHMLHTYHTVNLQRWLMQDLYNSLYTHHNIPCTGPPNPPADLSLVYDDTGIILQWSRPDCLRPTVPLNYTVTVSVNNGTNDTMEEMVCA